MRDFERCAPYAVNVQWKAEIHPRGERNKKPADLARIVKIMRDANYQGYMTLEYEAAEGPYNAVPRLLNTMRELLAK
jgi:hydroxypyruvate isomerase